MNCFTSIVQWRIVASWWTLQSEPVPCTTWSHPGVHVVGMECRLLRAMASSEFLTCVPGSIRPCLISPTYHADHDRYPMYSIMRPLTIRYPKGTQGIYAWNGWEMWMRRMRPLPNWSMIKWRGQRDVWSVIREVLMRWVLINDQMIHHFLLNFLGHVPLFMHGSGCARDESA